MKNGADPCVWVIIPVHNRKETTLRCLNHLEETQSRERFNVAVIDDGSTDGTHRAIQEQYPQTILLEGDGSLWWGGSIKKGMLFAVDHGADVVIWLNDDVLPEPNGVMKLAEKTAELGHTVLTTVVQTEPESDYTTRNKVTRWGIESLPYKTDLNIQPCDITAGKFTAIPRTIIEEIGYPDNDRFPHHNCDYDYTLRAKESGFNVGVYSEVEATDVGYELNTSQSRLSPEISLFEIIENTIKPSKRRNYTLRTMYYRDRRFYSTLTTSLIALTVHLSKSIGAIILKTLLCFIKENQYFRR